MSHKKRNRRAPTSGEYPYLSRVGAKAANLAILLDAGVKVPPFTVIEAQHFQNFIAAAGLVGPITDHLQQILNVKAPNGSDIQRISAQIQNLIKTAEFPNVLSKQITKQLRRSNVRGPFAVRSSAPFEDAASKSWAGQFDSYLNVPFSRLSDSILGCWASLFNARALSYDLTPYRNLSRLSIAVIVQSMARPTLAGVAFSRSPKSLGTQAVYIESVPGLADKLVSGRENPYAIEVSRSTDELYSPPAVLELLYGYLSRNDALQLRDTLCMLENFAGMPVDVEWAKTRREFEFVQLRPITVKIRNRLKIPRHPVLSNYELTFKVTGLSFLFTDMLVRGFSHMDPLFTFVDGDFKQYFTNERMNYAASHGVKWLSEKSAFLRYRNSFTHEYNSFVAYSDLILARSSVGQVATKRFFTKLQRLFWFYSHMDFPYTNLAYHAAKDNPVLLRNLELLSAFKDVARVWINKSCIDADSYYSRLLTKCSEACQLDSAQIEALSIEELGLAISENGYTIRESVLTDRNTSFVFYKRFGDALFLSGTKARNFIARFQRVDAIDPRAVIHGQVANRTTDSLSGIVRLINVDYANLTKLALEIEQMRQGEILVSEFTAPELLLACKKAKAIVTDLGGMLSHAAIVGRELGVSAIVGTRNASHLLKTGDEVEIDLRNGSVRKVKIETP